MAKPIVPWIGGKRKLADHILPLFPEHQCYVEPFAGAAALFFLKEPSPVEVINDINGELINLYRVIKHHLEELYRQFKWLLSSCQIWQWLQDTPVETLTDVQRAARFLYLQKLAFGGKVDGQTFGTATTSRPRFNIFRALLYLPRPKRGRINECVLSSGTYARLLARRQGSIHYA